MKPSKIKNPNLKTAATGVGSISGSEATIAMEKEKLKEWEQNSTLACLRMRPLLPQTIGERTLSTAVIKAMEETGHIDAKKASQEAAYSLRIKPEKCTQGKCFWILLYFFLKKFEEEV